MKLILLTLCLFIGLFIPQEGKPQEGKFQVATSHQQQDPSEKPKLKPIVCVEQTLTEDQAKKLIESTQKKLGYEVRNIQALKDKKT